MHVYQQVASSMHGIKLFVYQGYQEMYSYVKVFTTFCWSWESAFVACLI